jgi:hypothetical protein
MNITKEKMVFNMHRIKRHVPYDVWFAILSLIESSFPVEGEAEPPVIVPERNTIEALMGVPYRPRGPAAPPRAPDSPAEGATIADEAQLFFEICTSQLFGIPTGAELPKMRILLNNRDKEIIAYIKTKLKTGETQ